MTTLGLIFLIIYGVGLLASWWVIGREIYQGANPPEPGKIKGGNVPIALLSSIWYALLWPILIFIYSVWVSIEWIGEKNRGGSIAKLLRWEQK